MISSFIIGGFVTAIIGLGMFFVESLVIKVVGAVFFIYGLIFLVLAFIMADPFRELLNRL